MKYFSQIIFTLVILIALHSLSTAYAGTPWKITKEYWSKEDEDNYSNFIQTIGETDCKSFTECISSPRNPYREKISKNVKFYIDCAKLPLAFRAYFAWKNGLPFSYVNRVKPAGDSGDMRYNENGNIVASRRDILPTGNLLNPSYPDAWAAIGQMLREMNSAMYRFNPNRDDTITNDFYSPVIDRAHVRPGTIIYDSNGHIAMVYKVEDIGYIRYMDAHPGEPFTRGIYGPKFGRDNPTEGGGFKNWRPLRLVGANKFGNEYFGGKVMPTSNEDLRKHKDYSTEQYFKVRQASDGSWVQELYNINGERVDFYDFIHIRLFKGKFKYVPLFETKIMIESLCQDLQDRMKTVDAAINKGIDKKPHPKRLPENIYLAEGDWEDYSTSAQDARLKAAFVDLRKRVQKFVDLYNNHSVFLQYEGQNLPIDLLNLYLRETNTNKCQIKYYNLNNELVYLKFENVVQRLFKISFDCYHCSGLRWGESESCQNDKTKTLWYKAEQGLRNKIDRTFVPPGRYSLDDLMNHVSGSGVDSPPDVDVKKYLEGAVRKTENR